MWRLLRDYTRRLGNNLKDLKERKEYKDFLLFLSILYVISFLPNMI
jgi:hypothetical protein